ncbi:MAG: hypothetical protein ACREET_05510, partial [Stellaceae bacterium]
MPRSFKLLVSVVVGALVAVIAGATLAEPIAVGRRLVHPDGVSIELRSIDFRDDSIVVAATITNPGDRDIRLNRARSLVLDDGAHGVHYLSPPAGNSELLIPARTQLSGELVFVGPLASAAHSLKLSSNRGIGTADNPYDDAPVFEASLPTKGRGGGSGGTAASHPAGASLLVRRVVATPAACLVSLLATNGNDQTIVLNENGGLVLTNDEGQAAPLKPPTENRELVVPPGARLDAELLFDCRRVNAAGTLTLITNRGTAGTPDNPYDTLPVFTLTLPVEHSDAALPESSRASVAPVARSHLSEVTEVTAPVAAASGSRGATPPAPPPQPPPPLAGAAAPNSAAPARTTPPPAPKRQAPMSRAQLEA